jgi:hypothetical protein
MRADGRCVVVVVLWFVCKTLEAVVVVVVGTSASGAENVNERTGNK